MKGKITIEEIESGKIYKGEIIFDGEEFFWILFLPDHIMTVQHNALVSGGDGPKEIRKSLTLLIFDENRKFRGNGEVFLKEIFIQAVACHERHLGLFAYQESPVAIELGFRLDKKLLHEKMKLT